MNLVTIVLTTLNSGKYIQQSIESCLDQTYPLIELIIVDGGSSDDTLEIVRSFNDPRIRLVHQVDNQGKLPGAINLGLDHTRGEYLTWMQADCYYSQAAIEKMVAVLDRCPGVGQVYSDFWEIDENGSPLKVAQMREPEEFLDHLGDPAGVCFLIRRSVRAAIGLHDLEAYPSQDYDYRLRIAVKFPSYHLKEALYYWRIQGSSLTTQFGWKRLVYKDIAIRLKLGLDTPRQARIRKASIDIMDAFEQYKRGNYQAVPKNVLLGLKGDLSYLKNRGIWAITFKSVRQMILKRSI